MPDLWPDQLDDISDSLPLTPIIEQADLLAKHTGNLVKAELTSVEAEDEEFQFDFDLIVRVLDYRFTLFIATYGVEGYPVCLMPYPKICDELGLAPLDIGESATRRRRAIKADNEASLLEALGRILGSNTTKNILQTLIAQAKKFKK